ncbi:MAG: sensor domain-containing protein [Telluria sp.]
MHAPLPDELFRRLAEEGLDGVILIDGAGKICYVNAAFARLAGYGAGELLGESLNDLLPPAVARHHDAYLAAYLAGGQPSRVLGRVREMELRHRSGALLPVELKALDLGPGPGGGERLFGALVVDRRPAVAQAAADHELRQLQRFRSDGADILELVAREAPLETSLAAIARMLEAHLPGAVCTLMVLDPQRRTLLHGAAPSLAASFTRALDGLTAGPHAGGPFAAAWTGHPAVVRDIAAAPECDQWREAARAHGLRSCQSWPIVAANRAVLGSLTVFRLAPLAMVPADDEMARWCCHLAGVAIEHDRALASAQRLAFHDQLTGLPNRRLFADRLQQALARSVRSEDYGAVLLIDLDHFKDVNDTQGHAAGDELLRHVGARLRDALGASDTVARLGGDEFVVLLEGRGGAAPTVAAQANALADRLLAVLGDPADNHPAMPCSGSIGIALYQAGGPSADTLLREAELAMYRAKAAGRNTARLFDPHMQAALQRNSRLVADLRRAPLQGELWLAFQPQVDVTGRAHGAEALLRWSHPELGPVPPAEFIPLAEESGLMAAVGRHVLQLACATLVRWSMQPALRGLTLAVNVSIQQFRRPDFVATVLAALRASGAAANRLKLEITESIFADDLEETVARMAALRAHGIRFAIDDFGTGYSSLSYLKRLPLDQLKIDQSFVRDILTDANDASIAHTVIALARTLGLDVIAEGVETAAQRDLLRTYGCAAFQGYLYSRPVPEAEFEALIGRSLTASESR